MPRKPDGDKKKVIKSYQVDPDLFKEFEETALDNRVKSISSLIEDLIRQYVKKHKKKKE